jgi:hypothetical protein
VSKDKQEEKPQPKPEKEKWVCDVCNNPKCNGHLGIDV